MLPKCKKSNSWLSRSYFPILPRVDFHKQGDCKQTNGVISKVCCPAHDSVTNDVVKKLARSAGVFFGRANVFARESAMLKLPEERRKWGESKGAGRGRGIGGRENACPKTLTLRGRRKKGRGRGREKSAKEGKREGRAYYKSRCFCIPPTIFWTNPITSTVNTWPITSRALLSMVPT